MKLYALITSSEDAREAARWNIIDGIWLPAGDWQNVEELRPRITALADVFNGELIVELPPASVEQLMEWTNTITMWFPRVTLQFPMTPAGISACAHATHNKLKAAIGQATSILQVIISAKASPSLVRLDLQRLARSGDETAWEEVAQLRTLLNQHGYQAVALVADVSHPHNFACALECNIDGMLLTMELLHATMPHE